jgi:hypothetical protein
MPTTTDPTCTQTTVTSLWSMLWNAAPAVADRRNYGVIGAATGSGSGGQIRRRQPNQHGGGVDLAQGGRPMRERRPSTTMGVELCGRPVSVAIRQRASIC